MLVNAAIASQQVDIHLVQNTGETAEFLRWAATRQALAVDSETTTHERWTDSTYAPRLVQFADADTAWCLEPGHPAIATVLEGTRTLAFANAPFDIGVLSEMGTASAEALWAKAHDVLVMAHLLDSRGRRLGGCPLDLKSLAYYLIEDYSLKAVLYTKGGVSGEKRDMREAAKAHGYQRAGDEYKVLPVDHPVYLRYAGTDAIYTFLLAQKMLPALRQAGMLGLYERERGFQPLVHRMEQRGFSVAEKYARDTETLLADDVRQMCAELKSDWGLENPNSTSQVVKALHAAGVQWDALTKRKALSTARSVLEDMDHPLAAAVLDYRAEHKALTACVRPLIANVGSDGRVHPGFKTLGAVTARMSCKQPNLQQMPKRRGTAERMRSCLQAGHGLVGRSGLLGGVEGNAGLGNALKRIRVPA